MNIDKFEICSNALSAVKSCLPMAECFLLSNTETFKGMHYINETGSIFATLKYQSKYIVIYYSAENTPVIIEIRESWTRSCEKFYSIIKQKDGYISIYGSYAPPHYNQYNILANFCEYYNAISKNKNILLSGTT